MADNPTMIEHYEDQLSQLIQKMHKNGISYSTIGFVLSEAVKNLNLMAYCQAWVNQYATHENNKP